ncbi:5391_t:CDS:2, partial [Dentiscutata erythropus]
TPVLREELEFQDFSSGSGVGGKIAQDKQQTSNNNSGFSDATFFDQNRNTRSEQNVQHPIWSIEYYSQYFDVDTDQ